MATNSASSGEQPINLGAFESKAREHQSLIDDTNSKLNGLMGDFSTNIESMLTAVLSGTDARGDTPLSIEAKGLAALEAQQRKSEFLVSLGEDKEAASRLSNQAAQQFAAATREATQLAQTVSARKSVGFFDNPLEFIWNQLQLPDEENALNAKVNEATLAKGTIDTINKMESDTARNAEEFSQKLTLGSVQSQVEGMKNNLLAQSLQVKNQAIQQNVNMLERVVAADQKTLDNYMNVIQARNSAASLALAQQNAVEARARFAAWQQDQADTAAGQEQALALINNAAERFGRPKLAAAQFKSLRMINGGKLPPEIQTLLEYGYTNAVTGSTAYGTDPVTALKVTSTMGVQPPQWFSENYQSALRDVKQQQDLSGGKLFKTPQEYEMAVNQRMKQVVQEQSKTIDPRNTANPYLIDSPKVVGTNAAVQQSALWNKVLKTQIGESDTRDMSIIISRGLAAVQAGTISFPELEAGINAYVTAGVGINNENNQYANFGFAPQSDYWTKVKSKRAIIPDASQLINLRDSAALREFLVKEYTKDLAVTRAETATNRADFPNLW